ncbi:hypothetical protein LTA6_001084 [Microbacterium sp. LTA6]|uniref:hypothetical protein n=1 Tax=Microbacterium sp. LTA6 TaxID=3129771 RepID=UPI00324F02BF
MDHSTISALVLAEHIAGTLDPHDQRRREALSARDRHYAAQRRAVAIRRVREALARGLRRAAEVIEPPRPRCAAVVSERA